MHFTCINSWKINLNGSNNSNWGHFKMMFVSNSFEIIDQSIFIKAMWQNEWYLGPILTSWQPAPFDVGIYKKNVSHRKPGLLLGCHMAIQSEKELNLFVFFFFLFFFFFFFCFGKKYFLLLPCLIVSLCVESSARSFGRLCSDLSSGHSRIFN